MSGNESQVPKLVTTKPEAEIAADLKRRLAEALEPVNAIFDEAAQCGFQIQWDGIAPKPPFYKHAPVNLRILKTY